MIFSKYLNTTYLKIGAGIAALLVAFTFGSYVGVNYGQLKERNWAKEQVSVCQKDFETYRVASEASLQRLQKNADSWRKELQDAQARAIASAQKQESTRQNVQVVTKTLTKLKNVDRPVIIERPVKNECTLKDVTVNTDSADRLRNCFSSSNPANCANGNN